MKSKINLFFIASALFCFTISTSCSKEKFENSTQKVSQSVKKSSEGEITEESVQLILEELSGYEGYVKLSVDGDGNMNDNWEPGEPPVSGQVLCLGNIVNVSKCVTQHLNTHPWSCVSISQQNGFYTAVEC